MQDVFNLMSACMIVLFSLESAERLNCIHGLWVDVLKIAVALAAAICSAAYLWLVLS